MTVYKRTGSDVYAYDFQLDGRRYSGATGATDLEAARAFEQQMMADARGLSTLCRSVLRKAAVKSGMPRRGKRGGVYMIRSGYFVKIGHSLDPEERIRGIRTSSPNDCDLLFCIPGEVALERSLHREFVACHHQREWFFYCGKLKAFIEELMQERAQDAPPTSPDEDDEVAVSA